MATPNIVPRADSEGGLGTASKYWASAYIDLIYVGAGKVGRDSTDLIDFSTDNSIIFKINNANRLRLDASQMYPVTSDGVALGTGTNMFSDLFLATGAVINFGNGNVTLTHSSNALTLADGDILAFGTGSDIQIQHNSTNSFIDNYVGDLYITNAQDDGDVVLRSDDGSGGVTPYLTLDGGSGRVNFDVDAQFADGKKMRVGDGADLQLFHASGASQIYNQTGDLNISNDATDGDIILSLIHI